MEETLNVLVLMDFSDAIMERLKAISPRLKITRKFGKSVAEVPADLLANTDILYTSMLVPEPDTVPRLRWVQAHYAGVDWLLAQPMIQAQKPIITSVSGTHATTMAEYTFAMMLAFGRRIPLMLRHQQNAEWPADRFNLYIPTELRGATLGIVGYGSIGREIARLARAFSMQVLATKRDVMHPEAGNDFVVPGTGDPDGSQVERLYPPEATKSMVAECDYVVVLIPLTPTTKGLINQDILSAMKETAVLINIARGGVIDEAALIKALQTKKIAGAALDVFNQEPLPPSSPLWKLDNVIISPHISGNTARYHELTSSVFAENLERYLAHKDLLNRVDYERGY